MASITFSGQLDQAMNELSAAGNKILFIPQQNVGDVLEGAASEMTVASDGTYSITLAYNTYSIYHYSDITKRKRLLADGIVVSSETAVTTIPGLIGSTVPVTEDSVLTIQGYLSEANEAKTDAEAAQAATEALYEDFDSNVAGAMALVHTDTPSLSIPFNESGRLDYGIGTEYVSGLPVYGVDFTRSTSCYYINKSGLIDFADVDEIAIGKDGALLHSAITGLFPYSNDISSNDWTKENSTVEDDGTVAPYSSTLSGTTAYHLINSTDADIAHRVFDNTTTAAGWVTVCAIVKPDDGYENVSLEILAGDGNGSRVAVFNTSTLSFDSIGGNPEYYGYHSLSDGWFMIYIKFYDSTGTSGRNYLYFLPTGTSSNIFTGDGVSGGYVAYFQKFNSDVNVDLLCVTNGSSSSITATTCNVPLMGNMPTPDKGATFVIDSELGLQRGNLFGTGTGDAICWRYNDEGALEFTTDDGTYRYTNAIPASYLDGFNRYVWSINPNDNTIKSFVNGVQVGEQDISNLDLSLVPWFTAEDLIFGPSIIGRNSSPTKNFKILPYAASDDEVKSWGSPK